MFLQSKQTLSVSSTPNCSIVDNSFTYSAEENPLPHDRQNTAELDRTFFVLEHSGDADVNGRDNSTFEGLKGRISGLAK